MCKLRALEHAARTAAYEPARLFVHDHTQTGSHEDRMYTVAQILYRRM
jgi:hypothetical protein